MLIHTSMNMLGNSTVDWCEPNFIQSRWVAEWQNTLSCLPIVLAGLYGYSRKPDALFIVLTLVGITSTAFHATLARWAQALDELSLLLLVGCALERMQKQSMRARTALFVGATGTVVIHSKILQPMVFQITFISLCLKCYALLVRRWYWHPLFCLATLVTCVGVITWTVDYHACDTQQNMVHGMASEYVSLHAFWHTCCAFSLFVFSRLVTIVR